MADITLPLPADLPENWTMGQTVAPAGADAGLSEQHGYNYLSQQVNNAQKGVNLLEQTKQKTITGTAGQVVGFDGDGKAAAQAVPSHKHSAADITSGTLPVSRGGTGATTATAARTVLGAAATTELNALKTTVTKQALTGLFQVLTVSGTWTAPCDISNLKVTCIGGGCGGNYYGGKPSGAGGYGGNVVTKTVSVTAGQKITVTIGEGGDPDTTGSATSFGNLVTAEGGTFTTGDIDSKGGNGSSGRQNGTKGGKGTYGAGGGGGGASGYDSGTGGMPSNGGAGGGHGAGNGTMGTYSQGNGHRRGGNGGNGGGYGGGGGGAGGSQSGVGGCGADGAVILEW